MNIEELLAKAKNPSADRDEVAPILPGENRDILEVCRSFDDFAIWYTPGVAAPFKAIQADPDLVYEYTNKWNTVVVVSDGTRVLGLGDFGPKAGLPVMEGKALLYKYLGGVDCFPIMLDTASRARSWTTRTGSGWPRAWGDGATRRCVSSCSISWTPTCSVSPTRTASTFSSRSWSRWTIDLETFRIDITLKDTLVDKPRRTFRFVESNPNDRPAEEPGLAEFLQDPQLNDHATEEEVRLLRRHRFGRRRPNKLYYYRALQNLRDPLHFLGT